MDAASSAALCEEEEDDEMEVFEEEDDEMEVFEEDEDDEQEMCKWSCVRLRLRQGWLGEPSVPFSTGRDRRAPNRFVAAPASSGTPAVLSASGSRRRDVERSAWVVCSRRAAQNESLS